MLNLTGGVDWSADDDPSKEALCRKFPLPQNHDVERDAWFNSMEDALDVCNGTYTGPPCPFREKCLGHALKHNPKTGDFGVFGGMLPAQRRWIRKRKHQFPREIWDYSDSWRSEVPVKTFFGKRALTDPDYDR